MGDDGIVVYKRGEPVVPGLDDNIGALLQFVAADDLQVELYKLNLHMKRQEFQGRVDPRSLAVTDIMQHLNLLLTPPYKPWITAFAHNYDPENTAYLSINNRFDLIPVKHGESHAFDFKGSEERIWLIYYVCDPGLTATVQVNGKY